MNALPVYPNTFYSDGSCPSYSDHGTIIRRGIKYKKSPCYMHESACRWFIVKKATILWRYVKHF